MSHVDVCVDRVRCGLVRDVLWSYSMLGRWAWGVVWDTIGVLGCDWGGREFIPEQTNKTCYCFSDRVDVAVSEESDPGDDLGVSGF